MTSDAPGERSRHRRSRHADGEVEMTLEDVVDLCCQYEEGVTIEALASETGLSYRRVRTTLIASGVRLRPPMIPVPPCPPGMVELYANGSSIRTLARRFDRSYNQTRNMLLYAGVTLRPRGQSRE
jgi:lambda repressor-like predicted transcriptional regulator